MIAKGREVSGRNDIRCTVSIGGFVPKPHTPFQWAAQLDHETTDARLRKLRDVVRADKRYGRAIGFRYHDGKPGIIEGLLSRGDRRVGAVIEQVWRDGGRFDGWSEHFSYDRWVEAAETALAGTGVDLDWYTTRERDYDEVLPWDHLDSGLDKDWLWADWEDALDPSDATSRSRTAAGRPATTAASARRWAPRSRSAPPANSCSRSRWSEAPASDSSASPSREPPRQTTDESGKASAGLDLALQSSPVGGEAEARQGVAAGRLWSCRRRPPPTTDRR